MSDPPAFPWLLATIAVAIVAALIVLLLVLLGGPFDSDNAKNLNEMANS